MAFFFLLSARFFENNLNLLKKLFSYHNFSRIIFIVLTESIKKKKHKNACVIMIFPCCRSAEWSARCWRRSWRRASTSRHSGPSECSDLSGSSRACQVSWETNVPLRCCSARASCSSYQGGEDSTISKFFSKVTVWLIPITIRWRYTRKMRKDSFFLKYLSQG